MLEVNNLKAGLDGNEILKGISIKVNKGEVHSIMGPNGSGKSTTSKVLVGHPGFEVMGGGVTFNGEDLLAMDPEERAVKGLFLAYQYPVEVPGVNNAEFMRMAYNEKMKAEGKPEADPFDFDQIMDEKMNLLGMDKKYKQRSVNEGFSGGEKKKNEILQMAVLEPKLSILDEIDSGLDIDALKTVTESVNRLRNSETSMILITHYPRILEYVKPDHVHVLYAGKIIKSGGFDLAQALEKTGYDQLIKEATQG